LGYRPVLTTPVNLNGRFIMKYPALVAALAAATGLSTATLSGNYCSICATDGRCHMLMSSVNTCVQWWSTPDASWFCEEQSWGPCTPVPDEEENLELVTLGNGAQHYGRALPDGGTALLACDGSVLDVVYTAEEAASLRDAARVVTLE
jgi:hypothetical protein